MRRLRWRSGLSAALRRLADEVGGEPDADARPERVAGLDLSGAPEHWAARVRAGAGNAGAGRATRWRFTAPSPATSFLSAWSRPASGGATLSPDTLPEGAVPQVALPQVAGAQVSRPLFASPEAGAPLTSATPGQEAWPAFGAGALATGAGARPSVGPTVTAPPESTPPRGAARRARLRLSPPGSTLPHRPPVTEPVGLDESADAADRRAEVRPPACGVERSVASGPERSVASGQGRPTASGEGRRLVLPVSPSKVSDAPAPPTPGGALPTAELMPSSSPSSTVLGHERGHRTAAAPPRPLTHAALGHAPEQPIAPAPGPGRGTGAAYAAPPVAASSVLSLVPTAAPTPPPGPAVLPDGLWPALPGRPGLVTPPVDVAVVVARTQRLMAEQAAR